MAQVAVPARRSPQRPAPTAGSLLAGGRSRTVVPAASRCAAGVERSSPALRGCAGCCRLSCGKGGSCPSGEGDREAAVSSLPVGSGGGSLRGVVSAAPAAARAEPRRGAAFASRLSGAERAEPPQLPRFSRSPLGAPGAARGRRSPGSAEGAVPPTGCGRGGAAPLPPARTALRAWGCSGASGSCGETSLPLPAP